MNKMKQLFTRKEKERKPVQDGGSAVIHNHNNANAIDLTQNVNVPMKDMGEV